MNVDHIRFTFMLAMCISRCGDYAHTYVDGPAVSPLSLLLYSCSMLSVYKVQEIYCLFLKVGDTLHST